MLVHCSLTLALENATSPQAPATVTPFSEGLRPGIVIQMSPFDLACFVRVFYETEKETKAPREKTQSLFISKRG